jgi:hypothetical protein
VVVGSYATWATFYAGLIARNGVSGHGKYFIGLVIAGALAALLSSVRGVWGGLRWLVVPAAVVVAGVALRDLRNLEALIGDPAAGFYLPGRGPGLFVVIAGAVVMGLAPIVRPLRDAGAGRVAPTIAAMLLVAGVAVLVPGLYGEYYLHLANGHAHDHASALNSAHVLTAVGVLLAVLSSHVAIVGALKRET